MDDLDQVTRVLIVLARDGFERVTMGHLAEAAGVSRQTLYNRHRTKEKVVAWAAEGFSRHARLKACAALDAADRSTADCLVAALSERMGLLVPLVHGLPHGPETLDLATRLRLRHQADFPPFHADFTKALQLFLQVRGVCPTLAVADATAFLLMMSGKGLLMATRTRAAFEAGMARIVAVVLGEPPMAAEGALEDAVAIHAAGRADQ